MVLDLRVIISRISTGQKYIKASRKKRSKQTMTSSASEEGHMHDATFTAVARNAILLSGRKLLVMSKL